MANNYSNNGNEPKKPFKSLVGIVSTGKSFKANFFGFVRMDAVVGNPTSQGTIPVRFLTDLTEACLPDVNEKLGTGFQPDPVHHNFPMNITWFVNTPEEAESIKNSLKKGARFISDVMLRVDNYINRKNQQMVGLSAIVSQPHIIPSTDNVQQPNQQSAQYGQQPAAGTSQPQPVAPQGNPFQAQFSNATANGAQPSQSTSGQSQSNGGQDSQIADDDLPF